MEYRTEQINKWTNRSKQKVKKHLSLVYFSASKCFKKSFVNRVPILSEYPKFVMREGDTFFLIRRGFGTFGHSISVLLDTGKRRSRTAATSKMERFVIVIIIIGFLPLTIITKRSILDVSAVLDTPLIPMALSWKCPNFSNISVVNLDPFCIESFNLGLMLIIKAMEFANYSLLRQIFCFSKCTRIVNSSVTLFCYCSFITILVFCNFIDHTTQPSFAYSKSTMETLDQYVKSVQR